MYNQEVAAQLHPYTEEQQKEREHDMLVPQWRPVIHDGVDTGYSISNTGSLCNSRGELIPCHIDARTGYILCALSYQGQHYRTTIHRLVALAFIPNPEGKEQVNHINSNRQDNWYKNLEWVTRSENMQHSVASGFFNEGSVLAKKGEEHPGAWHTEDQARQVCELLEQGLSPRKIAKQTGIDYRFVYGILTAGKWKYVSDEYDIKNTIHDPLYTDEQIHECCRYLSEGKSNGWIAEKMDVPPFMPTSVRNGKLRPDISSQYSFPQVPQREGTRGLPSDTVHKICRLMELNVGVTEITMIFPEVSKGTIHQIKAHKQYTDISRQYKIPEPTKVRGVRTGRVKPGTSKSGMVARLGVGYDYDKVIAALTSQQSSSN